MINQNKTITFKSFNKETYHRSELLPEFLQLQQEIAHYTMPQTDDLEETIRLYDVGKHLEKLNEERNYIASKELEIFRSGNREICNRIKAMISGQYGENKVFSYLERLYCKNYILKNVELRSEVERTEIDAIVITEKKIFIIEVKNTSRDIFIDENGNYFRTGKYLRWDSNILDKMNTKENLLRKALSNAEIDGISVERIVVFTNYRIQVENACSNIKTTFLSQLPFIIDRAIGCTHYTSSEMESMKIAIEAAVNQESYAIDFDIDQYKANFVRLMNLLNGTEEPSKTRSSWFSSFFKPLGTILDMLYA